MAPKKFDKPVTAVVRATLDNQVRRARPLRVYSVATDNFVSKELSPENHQPCGMLK